MEIYDKLDDNSKRMMEILDDIRYHYDKHISPLYRPGGIHHIPKERRGLRLDNVYEFEEKGKNVN